MAERVRIIFAGSTSFGLPCLRMLLSRHEVVGVLSRADRRGRDGVPSANPIGLLARRCGLPLFRPSSLLDPALREELLRLRPELLVVASYGLIFPPSLLQLFPRGGLNVHGSLLPRWRGPAPIARALLSGDRWTGVTAIRMTEEVDRGEILGSSFLAIGADDTALSLEGRLAERAPDVLLAALRRGADPDFRPRTQDEQLSTYAGRLLKREACLDWRRSAEELERCIRAFNPWPVGYCYAGRRYVRLWEGRLALRSAPPPAEQPGSVLGEDGEGLLVLTGSGILALRALQFAGGRIRRAGGSADLGRLLPPGTVLSSRPPG